ncbi:pyruvate dehydrogenase E2 component (dihydrolipoamide acetyltransferase) [Pontibacter ummariensis]|uniref:Acetyltransferase component of pyruvate dehydrogenase complex n=1 Tax=Pontibacter ummariensis TaxID=1610492 RepID=A0A239C2B3_9BACT|nr:pyruvate dehydrogenase complex dihydrolipoamide acetyltransferase [Pontibacter ummariensis]PRY15521.1 pyruvate dehydrogenase E2 component (dihydrolipoamide acetyltransferase) [Pontibacter ummariensis]SNS13513.1 pyruvate dehydrogenase E2 component (dihydrolipoamide acetyltransferase) [Pontibacter ummariensis]
MAEVIRMPKMSDTMTEGVIASWLKKTGDKVSSGDILAEVETDKATMELESYEDGTLLYIGPKKGDSVPVDAVIAIIGKEGEDISGLLDEAKGGGKPAAREEKKEEETKTVASREEAPANVAIDTSNIKASVIRMPKMSDTMTEGVLVSWQKKTGDKVKSGDILAEVETDKATMELESYEDGVLLYTGVKEGDSVAVDAIIAIIGEAGADYETLLKAASSNKENRQENAKTDEAIENAADPATSDKVEETQVPGQTAAEQDTTGASADGGRIKASPLAKKMAEEKGYKLAQIKGTGEGGRIVMRDIENFTPSAAPQQQASKTAAPQAAPAAFQGVPTEEYEEVNVSQMRKVIARRLSESLYTAPHFYLTMSIDMDKAMEARASMNEISPVKISFNDLVIKAAAAALRQHPAVNSSWLGDKIRYNKHINIGVAVAVEEGLLVPVVRNADFKSLSAISAEVKDLGGKAKSKKLQPAQMEGSTFSISNLGMFGIDEFTAIINPPNACILAVGGISQVPVVKNGEIKVGNVMKVTLSCDHRVVDGAVGSAFLQTFKNLLENPVRILV